VRENAVSGPSRRNLENTNGAGRSLLFAPVRMLSVGSIRARFARDDRAQSLVEIALLMPMLVFLILAGGDLARAYALQLAVQNGARAGAEAAAIDFSPTSDEARARTLDELSRTPGLNPSDPSLIIDVTFKKSDGTTDCSGDPTVADPCWATVRVRYTFHTVTPWPLIPNTAHFDRTTSMRTIKAP
jgi:Flp pilus assembly protein TadG